MVRHDLEQDFRYVCVFSKYRERRYRGKETDLENLGYSRHMSLQQYLHSKKRFAFSFMMKNNEIVHLLVFGTVFSSECVPIFCAHHQAASPHQLHERQSFPSNRHHLSQNVCVAHNLCAYSRGLCALCGNYRIYILDDERSAHSVVWPSWIKNHLEKLVARCDE